MSEKITQIKTKISTLTAIAGFLLMAAEVNNENWGIPMLGATILLISILIIRSEYEN